MKLDTDVWRKLPAAGALLLIVGIGVLGVVYWNNVRGREEYLRGRNFRLLAVLASQTENTIATHARIIRNYDTWSPNDKTPNPCVPAPPPPWLKKALSGRTRAVKRCERSSVDPSETSLPVQAANVSAENHRIVLSWEPEVRASLVASDILGDTFREKRKQRAFDTVALAAPNGDVIYADGARSSELELMSLGTLMPSTNTTKGDFRSASNVIAEHPVSVAGVRYRMFIQPCCRGVGAVNSLTGAGLAIVGLVEETALRSAALAVSPLLVLSAVVAVLAALVSAVFLKVAFSSLRHRMSALDALQLGASSVFGVAMATILLITIGAYASILADVNGQLERLAAALDDGMDREITAAYRQNEQVTRQLLETKCKPLGQKTDRAECWTNREIYLASAARSNPYPGETAVSLVDPNGGQRIKSAPPNRGIPVDVADRSYFKDAVFRDDDKPTRLRRLTQCSSPSGTANVHPAGCVIESLRSWISGKPQVLLALATGHEQLPVASIAIPMRSLIDPILPAGLEFAVVDDQGLVQFHSDSARNVHENFLAETDQDSRLRSLIAARSTGHVGIDYWGRPYRAYVRPSAIDGWSIITLFDEQHGRALALEWAAASLVLLTAYMAVCVVVLLVVFSVGTSWLWPDPRRRAAYPLLALFYLAIIAAFGMLVWRADSTMRLAAGIVFPALAFMVTVILLGVRPKIEVLKPDWPALHREYQVMAALGLVVTAVVPGVAIVAFSHDLHVESFIKHRQIGLARAMAARPPWLKDDEKYTHGNPYLRHPLQDVDDYAFVFFDTAPQAVNASTGPAADVHRYSLVHLVLEDYMPYLSPFSIEMRELSHDHADDGSWRSRSDGNRLFLTVGRRGPGSELTLGSGLPALTLDRSMGTANLAVTIFLGLALFGLAYTVRAIVGFVLRRVFLSDVVEPIPAIRELLGTSGQDMFVVCDDPAVVAGQIKGGVPLRITPLATSTNLDAAWRQVQAAGDTAGPARAVVILDVDAARDQVEVMRRKLRLIEGLMDRSWQTVVLLSRVPPPVIAASARGWRSASTDRYADQLMARFEVFNWPSAAAAAGDTGGLATWWLRLADAWKTALTMVRQPSAWCKAIVKNEKESSEAIRRICEDLEQTDAVKSGALTCIQVLDEIEERARPIYLRIWRACSDDERIVLEHVAINGLANPGSRTVVRGLLTKGLLRKDPAWRLMNRTFTRFVLASERRLEVGRLEVAAEPGLWNQLRLPLGVGAVAVVIFLMTTQREMFDATVTVAAGMTTAMPTLLRLTSLFAGLRPAREAGGPKPS